MNQILALTDFSDASTNACNYAALLSSHLKIPLTLLNVVAPSAIVHDSMFASVIITQAELLQENRDLMDAEIIRIQDQYKIQVTGLVEEGYIYDHTTAFEQLHSPVLVVMGMKGKGKSNSIFGSTTTELIRKASYPILVMPENALCTKVERITYATDFTTDTGPGELDIVYRFAELYKAPVTILHIDTTGNLTAREALGKLKSSIHFSKVQAEFHSVANKNVVEGIQSFLATSPCSLLVMTAHKHTLFQRLFGKIHTTEMSYQSSVPLLVLKPR